MIPMTSAIIDTSSVFCKSNRKPAGYISEYIMRLARLHILCDSVWIRAHPRISAAARLRWLSHQRNGDLRSSDVDGHFTTDRYCDRNSFVEVIGRLFSRMSIDVCVCVCACVNIRSHRCVCFANAILESSRARGNPNMPIIQPCVDHARHRSSGSPLFRENFV